MEFQENSYYVIGLMSGTSLDGVDLAYTRIDVKEHQFSYQLIHTVTYPYPISWKNRLQQAISLTPQALKEMDITYGMFLADFIQKFIGENKISKIDLIASHGHTVFHQPEKGYTLQIGCGKTICKKTGLRTVYDFRTQDVLLGGQGAPLVPIGDKLLFTNDTHFLNLGGFANISFEQNEKWVAFDICPVNTVLNELSLRLGSPFDKDGALAASGIVDKELLDKLNACRYYQLPPPKSLGIEFVNEQILPILNSFDLPITTLIRTYCAHSVMQIAKVVSSKNASVLVTGGGAKNTFLIKELKKECKATITLPDEQLMDYKEALIFALLGVLRVRNEVNCLQSVTGARKNHSSGKVALPNENN